MKIVQSRREFLRNSGLVIAAAPAGAGMLGKGDPLQAEAAASGSAVPVNDPLAEGFVAPPDSARPWAYWWWMNGWASKEGIVRDLDEVKRQGIGGLLVFNAGQGPTPKVIPYMSQEWRELFGFAVREAAKRNIEISLNLCSGWIAGGPWIEASEAPQQVVFTRTETDGSRTFDSVLAEPRHEDPYYQDICVMAWRIEAGSAAGQEGTARVCLKSSATDISHAMAPDGRLRWQAPQGRWLIVRFGHTVLTPAEASHTKYCLKEDQGYEIDPLRAGLMDKQFAATAEKVIADSRSYVGLNKTLQYFHIDSWELTKPNWTPTFRADFRRLRGYDPFPYLAVLADETVDDHDVTARFTEDFNVTLSDLTCTHYYGRLAELSHQHGVGTHPESEGPELACVDSLKALGTGDIMMAEYWSRLTEPDGPAYYLTPSDLRFMDGIKGASSAAHTYGKKITQAEAFSELGSLPYSHYPFVLKDLGDRSFCAGLNRNVICFFQHKPQIGGMPGYAPSYEDASIGFKFSRKVTWWPMSHAWLLYLTRCQYLFQKGTPVADVCYFYGEEAPNFVAARDSMLPALPVGFDCDSIDAQALLGRMSVQNNRLSLPDGLSYRLLVMPQKLWVPHKVDPFSDFVNEYPGPGSGLPVGVSPAVLRKIKSLVEGGATVLGDRPVRAPGLTEYPDSDKEVQRIAGELWGTGGEVSGVRSVGKGRVIWGRQIQDVFAMDHVVPDFLFQSAELYTNIPYIHYRIDGAEVYFVANQRMRKETVACRFRVSGLQPELWDAVTGEIRDLPGFESDGVQTILPLEFAPRQSFFIVFRKPAASAHPSRARNFPRLQTVKRLRGSWEVSFDPKWDGPSRVVFKKLTDWTERPEEGIRYYSGTAAYRKSFEVPANAAGQRLFLDLGVVNHLANVRVNGHDLGVIWTAPWHTEITHAIKLGSNLLEIDVVNLWPNRLIGDAKLPAGKRFTLSNLTAKPNWELQPSGLLGPVTLRMEIA